MTKTIKILVMAALLNAMLVTCAWAAEPMSLKFLGDIGLAAGLAIGLAALGGALGQGRTAATALEGIARNPSAAGSITTPMIIGLALIESLVIYALVVAILLWTKIPAFAQIVAGGGH